MRDSIVYYLIILPAFFLQFIAVILFYILFPGTILGNSIYIIMKLFYIGLPLLALTMKIITPDNFFIQPGKKEFKEQLFWGIGTGLFLLISMIAIFYLFKPFFMTFKPLIKEKVKLYHLTEFYIPFAFFICFFHSLLEEVYYRWFLFRGLMKKYTWQWAGLLSSISFALHHYLLLAAYFPLSLIFLFGTAAGIGGYFWCWLLYKKKAIFGPWLSHLGADAGIMIIGYVLLFH